MLCSQSGERTGFDRPISAPDPAAEATGEIEERNKRPAPVLFRQQLRRGAGKICNL
jgi:hypothetical protein